MQVYNSSGIADDVHFQMRPAIRICDSQYECPDEDSGCPGTAYLLCALDSIPGASPISQQISFLVCWDEQKGEDWQAKASKCASAAKLDFGKIQTCAVGSGGTELKKNASDAFTKKFPTHKCGGIFGVPDVQINGKDQARPLTTESLVKSLCATGITAGACKKEDIISV
jgi:hypothetical protein